MDFIANMSRQRFPKHCDCFVDCHPVATQRARKRLEATDDWCYFSDMMTLVTIIFFGGTLSLALFLNHALDKREENHSRK